MNSGIEELRCGFRPTIILLCSILWGTGIAGAQQSAVRVDISEAGPQITTPVSNVEYPPAAGGHRLIRFSGRTLDTANHPMAGVTGITFAIYAEQNGGAPLWQETQNLATDVDGRFSVLLGATSEAGIPSEIFASGDSRWLGVLPHSPGVSEQARVLLVSVPYALRAEDSEMLGGKPASAYVTVNSQASSQSQCLRSDVTSSIVPASAMYSPIAAVPALVASGASSGYLPMFTNAGGDLTNSVMAQSGNNVGIRTSNPTRNLSVFDSSTAGRAFKVLEQGSDNTGAAAEVVSAGLAVLDLGNWDNVSSKWILRGFRNAQRIETGDMSSNGVPVQVFGVRADGYVGIGTASPDRLLTVNGAIHSTSGGFVFPDGSVLASAPSPSSSQLLGGNLILPAGSGANGAGNVEMQTANTSTNTAVDRLLIAGTPKTMSGAVPTANLFSLHIAKGDAAGGRVKFTIVASDGTHYAMETGEMIYLANPTQLTCAVVMSQYAQAPPSYTNTVLAVPAAGQSGFLNAQCNYALFGSDPGVQIFDTAPTSFTPTTHKVYYTIENQSQTPITLQP